jgi:arylsulfatase A-like enzyme
VTGRIEETVGLIDVAPTVFAALDVKRPASMTSGRNLVGLVSGSSPFWEDEPYLVEHKNTKQKGIVAGLWKMLVGRKRVTLTHVRNGKEWEIDPCEHPVTVRYLGARMTALLAGRGPAAAAAPTIVELSDEEKERLRALGYLLDDE